MIRLCQAAEVREIPFHGPRHIYASPSLMRGVTTEVVPQQPGHSAAAFTLNQYRWVYPSRRAAWALGIDELTKATAEGCSARRTDDCC